MKILYQCEIRRSCYEFQSLLGLARDFALCRFHGFLLAVRSALKGRLLRISPKFPRETGVLCLFSTLLF